MQKPRYQDYQADSIETVVEDNLKVRVIAGRYKSLTGPVVIQNPSMLLDVQIKAGGSFNQSVRYIPHTSSAVNKAIYLGLDLCRHIKIYEDNTWFEN